MRKTMNERARLGGLVAAGLVGLAAWMVMPQALAKNTVHPVAAASATAAQESPIGRFEGKADSNKQYGTFVVNPASELGWGWASSDDRRLGGHSTAVVALVHPGADGSHGSLQASGNLKSGFVAPWAGAIWFPGKVPMQPADLSGYHTLTFMARGKPGSYSVMVMAGSMHNVPVYTSFDLTSQWKRYSLPLATRFPGADFKHVYFVAFSAGAFGAFKFDLDNVALH